MEQKESTKPRETKAIPTVYITNYKKQKTVKILIPNGKQIKTSTLSAATEATQHENKKPRNEWRDEECRKAMEEKNLARMKCIKRRTRTNQTDYTQKKKDCQLYM